MTDTTAFLDALAAQSLPDGGWGYAPGLSAHVEPTCLALLALSAAPDRYAALLERGRGFLARCAVDDGRYRLERGRPEAVWPTALVLCTRAVLNDPRVELDTTAAALLGLRGRPTEGKKDEVNDIDPTLIGWPWAEGNFSWAEPTAWACLALRRVGQGGHPRVVEGLNLLRDRTLEGGGVNYGNRRIFGVSLEPIPTPTALMLLALQGGDDPRLTASVGYLVRHAADSDDLEHLAWARLALDLYRAHDGVTAALARLDGRIRDAHAARLVNPYVRPAPLRDALTALALDADRVNPFRLPATLPEAPPLTPREAPPPRRSFGERVRGFMQGLAVTASGVLRPLDAQTDVHIAPVGGYDADLADVVRRQYEHFRNKVPLAGKRVVLKPNLVEYHRDKVINTHPHVVAAVIELCRREEAAEVIVAEGPGHWRNVEYLVAASGLGDVLRTYKVPFVDLNHDEPVKRVNLGRLTGLEHLFLAQTIATADVVISLPKLKTHHWAGATLALKNLFGTLPGVCYGWPKNELHWRGIDNSIVDIALTRTPDLAVVDGVVGMEGDGPLNGSPVRTGVLVMGADLVAVDATCCRLMQLNPEQIGYLVLGANKRLGLLPEAKVRQLGETVAERARPFRTVDLWKHIHVGPRPQAAPAVEKAGV